jgi:formate dehydrogenase alpha subunit
VKEALGRLDLLVVQDVLLTETAELAHVVLPGAAFAEKGGSFTNMEGRVQVFGPAATPLGEARPDWEILTDLATRLGQDFGYRSERRIRDEIRKLSPLYAGMGDADFGWIAPGGGPDVPDLSGQRPEFVLPDLSSAWSADPDYPITLFLGATRFHLGSGTRTSRSPRIRALNLACEIEISPEDGAALDIEDQAPVRVVSSTGAIEAVARLRNGVPPGLAFSAQGADGNRVMQLATLEEYGRGDLPVRLEKA